MFWPIVIYIFLVIVTFPWLSARITWYIGVNSIADGILQNTCRSIIAAPSFTCTQTHSSNSGETRPVLCRELLWQHRCYRAKCFRLFFDGTATPSTWQLSNRLCSPCDRFRVSGSWFAGICRFASAGDDSCLFRECIEMLDIPGPYPFLRHLAFLQYGSCNFHVGKISSLEEKTVYPDGIYQTSRGKKTLCKERGPELWNELRLVEGLWRLPLWKNPLNIGRNFREVRSRMIARLAGGILRRLYRVFSPPFPTLPFFSPFFFFWCGPSASILWIYRTKNDGNSNQLK